MLRSPRGAGLVALVLAALVLGPMAPAAYAGTCPTVDSNGIVTPAPAGAATDWSGCDLTNGGTVRPRLDQADLAGANLSGANLRGAWISWAHMAGADLRGANLTNTLLSYVDLASARLDGANVTGANIESGWLTGAVTGPVVGQPSGVPPGWLFMDGWFIGPGANVSGANLAGVYLRSRVLPGARFDRAHLDRADMTGADVHGASFAGASLAGTYLATANLASAGLAGASLSGAHLTGAYLVGANLTGADLTGADLSGANLTGATLTSATTSGAVWTGAVCPDGWGASRHLDGTCLSALDITGPTVTMTALPVFTTLASRVVTVSWSATDAGSGVATSQFRWARVGAAGGTLSPWVYAARWSALPTRNLRINASLGYRYCFSVRATDRMGNVGAWSPSVCTTIPRDDRTLARIKPASWASGTGTSWLAGTVTAGSTLGASLQTTTAVRVRQVGVVATTCRACGQVAVYVGATRVGILSLARPTYNGRTLLVLPRMSVTRIGVVRLVVLTSRKLVRVDGLALTAF